MWELVTHSVKALYPTKLETPKRQKKFIKLGEIKRKKKNMAIEVFLPIDVLVIPFGPDVSTVLAKNSIQGKALMSWK